jgi:hypothetical protein
MIIQIQGTDLGNDTLIQAKVEGTPEQLVTLIVGAMHNNPPFAEVMEEAYARYLIDIGALNEE